MGIKQEIEDIKTLFGEGAALLMLRLRILKLDAESQAAGVVKIAAIICAAAVLGLTGLIAALFGLNAVLPPEAKIWAFFGIAAGALVLAACLLLQIAGIWKKGSDQVGRTLADMQEDWAYLAGLKRKQAYRPEEGEKHVGTQ